MPKKADVINMAAHRDLVNPTGSIHFAFEDVMTEEELNRRVRLVTDLIYSLGGRLNDDRGECVSLEATDSSSGTTWEGGGLETNYAPPNTGNRNDDKKIRLEELLHTYMRLDPNQELDFKLYIPLPGVIITYDTKDYDRYYVDAIHMSKKGFRVLEVFQGSDSLELNKAQLEDGGVRVFHRVRPQR